MIRYPLTFLSAICIGLVSCDSAKKAGEKLTSAIREEMAKQVNQATSKPADPELAKLVDQTDLGVLFRKDLPFPTRLQIVTTQSRDEDTQVFSKSFVESSNSKKIGTTVKVTLLERAGDQIRHTLQQHTYTAPAKPDQKDPNPAQDMLAQMSKKPEPNLFKKTAGKWKNGGGGNFHNASLAQTLAPYLDEMLIEHAAAARPLWLSKKRYKKGDKISLNDQSIGMIVAGKAQGQLELIFDEIDAVEGHPCGKFSISGNFERKQFANFDGQITDQQISIQSGHIWLSLLHPIVLKEELDLIIQEQATGDGTSVRTQGKAKVHTTRAWTSL